LDQILIAHATNLLLIAFRANMQSIINVLVPKLLLLFETWIEVQLFISIHFKYNKKFNKICFTILCSMRKPSSIVHPTKFWSGHGMFSHGIDYKHFDFYIYNFN